LLRAVCDDFCSNTFKVAQQNFVGSMAAYSMICFILQVVGFLSVLFIISAAVALLLLPFLLLLLDLTKFLSLQIKDRHDGNILIKRDGRCASFYVLFDFWLFKWSARLFDNLAQHCAYRLRLDARKGQGHCNDITMGIYCFHFDSVLCRSCL
jgi:hypothetical protein